MVAIFVTNFALSAVFLEFFLSGLGFEICIVINI